MVAALPILTNTCHFRVLSHARKGRGSLFSHTCSVHHIKEGSFTIGVLLLLQLFFERLIEDSNALWVFWRVIPKMSCSFCLVKAAYLLSLFSRRVSLAVFIHAHVNGNACRFASCGCAKVWLGLSVQWLASFAVRLKEVQASRERACYQLPGGCTQIDPKAYQ